MPPVEGELGAFNHGDVGDEERVEVAVEVFHSHGIYTHIHLNSKIDMDISRYACVFGCG